MTNGKLIVFEGLDKAGKETQAKMLAIYLEGRKYYVSQYDFPDYHTHSGQLIRDYLSGQLKVSQRTINMIYSVNRYEKKWIVEHLLNNECIVICDRYYYSNMAYGCTTNSEYGQSLEMEEIEELDNEMPQPDLVIYIDVSGRISVERSGKNADINERNINFLEHARRRYLLMALHDPKWQVVNGEEDKQEVHDQIVSLVEDKLFKKQ